MGREEFDLIEVGPAAVLDATRLPSDEIAFDAVGMACSRKARAAGSIAEALAWVDAGVAAHMAEAMRQPVGWDRQGREVSAQGLAVWSIEKHGLEVGRNRRLAHELVEWVAQGMEPFSSADEFRRSLVRVGEMHTFALLLRERLRLAARVPEVLPASFAEWIEVEERVRSSTLVRWADARRMKRFAYCAWFRELVLLRVASRLPEQASRCCELIEARRHNVKQ